MNTMGVVKLFSPFGRLVDQTVRLSWDGTVTFARCNALPYVVERAMYFDGIVEPYVVWAAQNGPMVLRIGDRLQLNFHNSKAPA